MAAFKMLLNNKRYTAYQSQIEGLFDELSRCLTTIPASRIRNMMGMPNNWRRLGSLT